MLSSTHPTRLRLRRRWHALRRSRLALPLATALLLAACDQRDGRVWIGEAASGGALEGGGAPSAEFLLTGVDSSFWIVTGPDAGPTGLSVRRAPLALTRVGGRWHELYLVEEDHSFPDAIFIVQELWRRDLVSQDSALVLGDSLVPALAAQYARANPDQMPLAPDEPEDDDPSIIAVAELSLLDVQGRYASVERYSDLHLPRRRERHELRRAVVDIGRGAEVRLAALVGESAAVDIARRGRAALVASRDSARRVAGEFDAAAAAALDRFTFDDRSFALTQVADQPGVVFYAVGRGDAADGFALPLSPIAFTGGAWWDSARVELPVADDSRSGRGRGTAASGSRWRRGELSVMATPDDEQSVPPGSRSRPPTSGYGSGTAISSQRLTLRDSSGREWPLGSVSASAQRLYWLDRGGVSERERRAIARAFYESAFHDGTLRAASARGDRSSPHPGGTVATSSRLTAARSPSRPGAAPVAARMASFTGPPTQASAVRRAVRPLPFRSSSPAPSR